MKKSTKLSAFTLIELLIVIAVIGILAGMLFPAIKAVMNSAQGTRVANNGKQIVTAITSANIDREQNSKGDIWPSINKWSGDGGANKYFSSIMGNNEKGRVELTGISVSMFAGGGVDAAQDAKELETKGNIWNMLAGISASDDNTPFIWTRNGDGIEAADFNTAVGSETGWGDKLKSGETPFSDQQLVLARKGASFQIIKVKDLTSDSFLASTTNDTSTIEVCKAVAGEAEDTDY